LSRLQGFVTESLRVAFPSSRKRYDFVCNGVSGWSDGPVCMLESHEGHLKSNPQNTGSLRVEPVTLQVMPDRHGRQYGRKFPAVKGNWSISGELTRKE
jgi:hypothetical protein